MAWHFCQKLHLLIWVESWLWGIALDQGLTRASENRRSDRASNLCNFFRGDIIHIKTSNIVRLLFGSDFPPCYDLVILLLLVRSHQLCLRLLSILSKSTYTLLLLELSCATWYLWITLLFRLWVLVTTYWRTMLIWNVHQIIPAWSLIFDSTLLELHDWQPGIITSTIGLFNASLTTIVSHTFNRLWLLLLIIIVSQLDRRLLLPF